MPFQYWTLLVRNYCNRCLLQGVWRISNDIGGDGTHFLHWHRSATTALLSWSLASSSQPQFQPTLLQPFHKHSTMPIQMPSPLYPLLLTTVTISICSHYLKKDINKKSRNQFSCEEKRRHSYGGLGWVEHDACGLRVGVLNGWTYSCL